MRRCRRLGILVCVAVTATELPAMAQVSTGQIFGKVSDSSSTMLSGVTVTLNGPALIQPLGAVSSESGAFRFPPIPIGTYELSFELTGFKRLVRTDIIIQAGFNAEVNARLEISTVLETVTVSGSSPVVDTQSTVLSASFSREALETIPSARDPWALIEQTPGVIMSAANVGGNLSGQQASFNAMGSSTNQQWIINGAVITDIASGNSSPTYYDFDSFQEVQITTAGADASQQGAGVQVNFITRGGSNNFSGDARFFNTNDRCFGAVGSCQAINVTDDMRARGAGSGNPIQNINEVGGQFGGPIARNKAWFWGAMSRQDVRVGVLGFYNTATPGCQAIATSGSSAKNPDGSFVYTIDQIKECLFGDLTTLTNHNARLQYQETTGQQSSFSYTYGDKYRSSRGCDAFHPLITCSKQTGPTIFYTGDHRWIASNRLTVIGQYTHIHNDWYLGFEEPRLADVQSINWVDTTYWDRGKSSASYHTIRPQDDVRADGNYFAPNVLRADHAIKFGFAWRRSPVESISSVGGGAVARYRGIYQFRPGQYITTLDTAAVGFASNKAGCTIHGVTYAAGTPTGCDEADIQRDAEFTYNLYQRNLYVQDSIKKGRATINLGLRFDHQHDLATPGTVPANRILPAQLPAINFPGADSGVRYNDWSPRLGVTYDVTGDGKTVAKASYARYYGIGVFTSQALEPTGSTTTLRFPWKDLNGDKVVQASELQVFRADGSLNLLNSPAGYDAARPASPVTTSIVDPNMTNDKTDEMIVGLDRELMRNFGIGAMFIYRQYHNFCGSGQLGCVGGAVRYLDSSSNYAGPVPFTAACGNSLCSQSSYSGYYFTGPALHSNTIEQNITEYRTYQGLEFTARRRLANHWMLTGSYVYNHEQVFMPSSIDWTNLDPTNHVPNERVSGHEDGTRNGPHAFKLSGLYQFKWGLGAAANYLAHSNFPFNPTLVTGTRPNGLGTATIFLTGQNSLRYPTVRTLDLNVDKAIRMGGPRRLTLSVAMFNTLNANTTLAQTVRQNTSTANFLTTIVGPRVIRFAARFHF